MSKKGHDDTSFNETSAPGRVLDALLPDLYDELKRLAKAQLQRERMGHTLQTTALAHEAYLRLVKQYKLDTNRKQFFIAAAKVIQRVLIDHARSLAARKRGGGAQQFALASIDVVENKPLSPMKLLQLNDAIEELGTMNERAEQVVKLRFFGGLTIAETADTLGISTRAVAGDWDIARLWLRSKLKP